MEECPKTRKFCIQRGKVKRYVQNFSTPVGLNRERVNLFYRNDLNALDMIEDNIYGYLYYFDDGRQSAVIVTDTRVRYHDWSKRELSVLKRIPLLTAKPIV